MDDLFLGVDGGGSKTRALLTDAAGAVLGTGSAGSSNYQAVGFEAAITAIEQAVATAFHDAGRAGPAAAACLGLAGAGRPDDRARFEAWTARANFAQRCTIVGDAELVLAAGTPEGWGVALICGTGSIGYARATDGRSARAGGWGYVLGDEGSGYDIARHALRLATQTADGRAIAPTILQAALEHWGLSEPQQLVQQIYRSGMAAADIATLAQRIAALCEAGDAHAAAIVDEAAQELARIGLAAARQLGLQRPPLALAGGLFGASPRLREGIAARAGNALGPFVYVAEPAQGALVIARRMTE